MIKGTHTVYFITCSSFYIINQKPMIPTTDSFYNRMGCIFFWVNGQCIGLLFSFVITRQRALLFNINIKTEYILIARPHCALAGKVNIFLHKKFLYKIILNDINEKNTSFLDCKHKHTMKAELHLTKSGSYTSSVTCRILRCHKQN